MSAAPKRHRPGRRAAAVLLALIAIVLAAPLYAPMLAAHALRSALANTGLTLRRVEIKTLNWTRAHIRHLELGSAQSGLDLVVSDITAAYSPIELVRFRVRRVTIAGLRARLDEAFFNAPSRFDPAMLRMVLIRELNVTDSELLLTRRNRELRIPFTLSVEMAAPAGPNDGGLSGTLRISDVQLAEAAAFAGGPVTQGSGVLDGEIPFRYADDRVTVANAYLETTPGSDGRIAVRDGGFLTRFVSPEDAQYIYVSIAEEALKDFRYDALRADFSMVDDNINAALRIKGAPAGRLPFRFDARKREFVPCPPEKSNANFSNGVDLTVRLNDLALEDLLFSRQTLDMLLRKGAGNQ